MDKHHAANIMVALELLESFLNLPYGVKLKGVYPSERVFGCAPNCAMFYLTDETGEVLPEQKEGERAELCQFLFSKNNVSGETILEEVRHPDGKSIVSFPKKPESSENDPDTIWGVMRQKEETDAPL